MYRKPSGIEVTALAEFRRVLKPAIKDTKLTQAEFAERLGLSGTFYSNTFNGLVPITSERVFLTVRGLAEFGIDSKRLFDVYRLGLEVIALQTQLDEFVIFNRNAIRRRVEEICESVKGCDENK